MITYILAAMVVILYVLGGVLMRALLKVADTTDQDNWKPIVFWPYYIAQPVVELVFSKKFKW